MIGIIGAGNMGRAIIKGLKNTSFKDSILIFEKDKKKSKEILKKFKVKKSLNIEALVKKSDTIIICVKPQQIDGLLKELAFFSLKDKLIISIAAGINISYILEKLGVKTAVIRVMPNVNAFAQKSVNALCAGKYAKKENLLLTKRIFSAIGVNFVVREKDMNAVTAVSGSGPAYAALLMKALADAGENIGLSKGRADEMVKQTFLGTIAVLDQQKMNYNKFIESVKSKGGTTEAALGVFEKRKLEDIISEGVYAACKRAGELGR